LYRVSIILLFESSTTSLFAHESTKALPGEPCKVEPLKDWTPQEKWVWKQVCEGKIADFNEAEGYGGELGTQIPFVWCLAKKPDFELIISGNNSFV
jgi:hypothetical protein